MEIIKQLHNLCKDVYMVDATQAQSLLCLIELLQKKVLPLLGTFNIS
jgi:hypothetical protein